MPITSPLLDDLRYDQTVQDLVRRIPVYAPEWTDHNDSDPGIALIQLFAYLAEQIGYRLNRVPEKNHVELLKLLGVRLQPAHAARTTLALLLADLGNLKAYTLRAGARVRASLGDPPATFETDRDIDVVPAQPTVLVTTRSDLLWDLRRNDSDVDPALLPSKVPDPDTEWLTVAWDGKKPKPKDMPREPVPLAPRRRHRYLWVGVNFNPDRDAGFVGVQVTLTFQFDDDEQPRLDASQPCCQCGRTELAAGGCCGEPHQESERAPSPASEEPWLHYFDTAAAPPAPADAPISGEPPAVQPTAAPEWAMARVPGQIEDTTARLTRSGAIRFVVPFTIGVPPADAWLDLHRPTLTSLDACRQTAAEMRKGLLGNLPSAEDIAKATDGTELAALLNRLSGVFRKAVDDADKTAQQRASEASERIGHPLDPQLRSTEKVKGWLRITLPESFPSGPSSPRLRMITYNAVPATHAETVTNELLGTGDGTPGQTRRLMQGHILPGTLQLAVQESSEPATPLVTWQQSESLDTAGPFDRVFELDPEAGLIRFGDGHFGRIVPLVPGGGQIVALRYRHGGGKAGELPVAGISKALDTPAVGIDRAINIVAAAGGRDAETLEDAKRRARKELSTRSRAVTAGDFEWIAGQTPGVRVARAEVVPLRRPLAAEAPEKPLSTPHCGPVPAGPAGLDTIPAFGAVSVVVVPDEAGPEPVPTPSFLRQVCDQLNRHRLVTTEVYVVPPQYLRLCNFTIVVRAQPGYTRSRLQELVESRLATYLHVLRGGEDGGGFPFGSQLHVADLMAQVFRTEGVDRVESLRADFTRTKRNANPRQGSLTLCPLATDQFNRIDLAPEENVSIELSSFTLTSIAD